MGAVRACRALLPQMAARGTGAVVNTGSDLAKQPEPGFVDYGACKAALLYVTKALAKAVRASGTREHRAAWADLVTDVDEAGRDRRPARATLWSGARGVGHAIPERPADADGNWTTGGCRARRRLSRIATRPVHHGSQFRYRRNNSRFDLGALLLRCGPDARGLRCWLDFGSARRDEQGLFELRFAGQDCHCHRRLAGHWQSDSARSGAGRRACGAGKAP